MINVEVCFYGKAEYTHEEQIEWSSWKLRWQYRGWKESQAKYEKL